MNNLGLALSQLAGRLSAGADETEESAHESEGAASAVGAGSNDRIGSLRTLLYAKRIVRRASRWLQRS